MEIKRIVFTYNDLDYATSSYSQDFRMIAEDYIKSSGNKLKLKEILPIDQFNKKYIETRYMDKISLFYVQEAQ